MIDKFTFSGYPVADSMNQHGQVIRIVPTMGLAYLEELSSGRVIGFPINLVEGFKGDSFQELGVVPGAKFSFKATLDGRMLSVSRQTTELEASNVATAS